MSLKLSIVTPERSVTLSNLRQVVFQATQGETGVLPGHAALISLCECGIVRAFDADADPNAPPNCFVIGTGSLRAIHDHLILLTNRMQNEDELDAEAAEEELAEAKAVLMTLDPILDRELYDEACMDAAFCEAILALDYEISHRLRILI